jgi:hypothetical protein
VTFPAWRSASSASRRLRSIEDSFGSDRDGSELVGIRFV